MVGAELRYIARPEHNDKLYRYRHQPGVAATHEQNFGYELYRIEVEDLRGQEGTMTLDGNGFQYFRQPAQHTRFMIDEEIRNEYYPESERLLLELTGASRIIFFDHSA
jgi:hypothetical protein